MMRSTIGSEGFTMGIDMGDRWSHYVTLDNETGEVVEDGKVWSCELGFRLEFGNRNNLPERPEERSGRRPVPGASGAVGR